MVFAGPATVKISDLEFLRFVVFAGPAMVNSRTPVPHALTVEIGLQIADFQYIRLMMYHRFSSYKYYVAGNSLPHQVLLFLVICILAESCVAW